MNKLRDIILWDPTDIWNHNISIYSRFEFDNNNLKSVEIIPSPVGEPPRTTSRVHKITMFKRFRHNLLKTSIAFKGNQ